HRNTIITASHHLVTSSAAAHHPPHCRHPRGSTLMPPSSTPPRPHRHSRVRLELSQTRGCLVAVGQLEDAAGLAE
nr:hypothetical protein [Tanacetum cinerariifolium]